MTRHVSGRLPYLRLLPAFVLIALSVWAFASQRNEQDATPSAEEWALGQNVIRAGYRPGDVIRVAPIWADQARTNMWDFTFNHAERIIEEELYQFDRLWILADEEHFEDAVESRLPEYELVQTWAPSPRVRVALIDIPQRDDVLFDFVLGLEEAEVTHVGNGQNEQCRRWIENGWHCGARHDYATVTRAIDEMGGQDRQCNWLGVLPDGVVTHVTWRGVMLGRGIEGNQGNPLLSARLEGGTPVNVQIRIDGQVVYEHNVPIHDWSWPRFRIDTRHLAGTQHDVTFSFWAAEHLDRLNCFRGRVLE